MHKCLTLDANGKAFKMRGARMERETLSLASDQGQGLTV